jgi:hypothetical protein
MSKLSEFLAKKKKQKAIKSAEKAIAKYEKLIKNDELVLGSSEEAIGYIDGVKTVVTKLNDIQNLDTKAINQAAKELDKAGKALAAYITKRAKVEKTALAAVAAFDKMKAKNKGLGDVGGEVSKLYTACSNGPRSILNSSSRADCSIDKINDLIAHLKQGTKALSKLFGVRTKVLKEAKKIQDEFGALTNKHGGAETILKAHSSVTDKYKEAANINKRLQEKLEGQKDTKEISDCVFELKEHIKALKKLPKKLFKPENVKIYKKSVKNGFNDGNDSTVISNPNPLSLAKAVIDDDEDYTYPTTSSSTKTINKLERTNSSSSIDNVNSRRSSASSTQSPKSPARITATTVTVSSSEPITNSAHTCNDNTYDETSADELSQSSQSSKNTKSNSTHQQSMSKYFCGCGFFLKRSSNKTKKAESANKTISSTTHQQNTTRPIL